MEECLFMSKYLGVTTNSETEEIQICCSSEADAQTLADELSFWLSLRDEKKPKVSSYRINYHGNVWLLKTFLTSRNWNLTADMHTRFIFDKSDPDKPNTANFGIS
jgi:hypothetical protein